MAPAAQTRKPVTKEDLNELVFLGSPTLSPDGTRVAFVHKTISDKNVYDTNIWMVDADRGDPRPFTNGKLDGAPCFSPDGKAIAFIGGRTKGSPQVYIIPTDGGEARALTEFPEGVMYNLRFSPDGRQLAVAFREQDERCTKAASKDRTEAGGSTPPIITESIWYRLDGDGYFSERRFKLYVIDIKTGTHRMVWGKDTLGYFEYDWSPNGRTLAISTNWHKDALKRADLTRLILLDVASGAITQLDTLPDGPKTGIVFSPNGRHIAYAGRRGKDHTYSTMNLELWVCDVRTGRARCLSEDTDWCLMAAVLSDASEASFEACVAWTDNDRVLAQIGWQGEAHVAAFDRRGRTKPRLLTHGRIVITPGNLSTGGKRIVCLVDQPTAPPEIHVGRLSASGITFRKRTAFNDAWVRTKAIARPTMRWVRSEDGTRIQTWCLKPPTIKRKKYPGIVEVHGGPHGQYGYAFFHEFQLLAANGYVVVYANPRGSKGYGADFCGAIRGRWGTVDWEDIHAVARWMENCPFVDANRLGIMGGSYGGYMANWAIGSTQMFTAAISDRCVSNMVSMAGNSDFPLEPGGYWPGNAWDEPEALWASSPMRLMGNARTPTLLIHSQGDLRCNIEQADQVFSALRQQNVPARFVRYPPETSHGMSRGGPPDMRQHRLNEILQWWARWFSPRKKRR